jgi:hypothetical protein
MLRLQFYFLMNRTSVVFLLSASLLLGGAMLYASRFFEGNALLDATREAGQMAYLTESIGVAKFILIATALFLNLHCFSAGNGRYSAFFMAGSRERLRFMASKLLMIGFVIVTMTANGWLMYNVIGVSLTPYFESVPKATMLFVWIGLESLGFGLLEAALMQLTDSLFSGIIPLAFFWFLEAFGNPETVNSSTLLKYRI